jgi:DNA polymerase-3 subunit alpha
VFNRFSHFITQGNLLYIEGKIETRDGKRQFIIQSMDEVQAAIEKEENKEPTLYLKITKEHENAELLHGLKSLFRQNEGKSQVVIFYESSNKSLRLGEEDLVNPSASFIEKLKEILGENNVILKR